MVIIADMKNKMPPRCFNRLSKSHSRRHWCVKHHYLPADGQIGNTKKPPFYGRCTDNITFSVSFKKTFIFSTLIVKEMW